MTKTTHTDKSKPEELPDAVKASLEANDPTHSNAAYTSHESGVADKPEDGE